MRCLIAADLHYSLKQFDWLVERAADFDLVVLAGDHLEIASSVDRTTQSLVIGRYFQRLRAITRLIVCSGNHDLDWETVDGERIARWLSRARQHDILIDGESIEFGGTLFSACAWWDGPKTQEAVGRQLEEAASRHSGTWVWIYHAPPAESPTSWAGRRTFGDPVLAGWIARHRPDIVISGHVHEAPFVDGGSWADRVGRTWIFNAGREPGNQPTHIVLDTDVGEALWVSSTSTELAELNSPLGRPVGPIRQPPTWFTS
jgi:Icc-related predicted phosphoesterase